MVTMLRQYIDYQKKKLIDLETDFSKSLQDYCDGKIANSTYIDTLRKKQLETLKVKILSNTLGNYEEQKENYTTSMTNFIYSLYEKYDIIVRPIIPITDWNIGEDKGRIEIYKANYDEMLISDNVSAIQNLSITNSIEKTNKLVIFSKGGVGNIYSVLVGRGYSYACYACTKL